MSSITPKRVQRLLEKQSPDDVHMIDGNGERIGD